jgi:hypothetical protein
MWPKCVVDALTPFPRSLQDQPPDYLAGAFRRAGWSHEDGFLPVRLVALLGMCSTDKYKACPNLPQWHLDNAGEDGDEYLEDIGRYFWCDFDLIDRKGSRTKLRMTFNEGDADRNDGTWGVVWDRDSGEVVADLTSVGDCEGRVEVVSEKHSRAYLPHSRPIPTDNDYDGTWGGETCALPFTLVYGKDLELEKLLGVAMRWCISYRGAWV